MTSLISSAELMFWTFFLWSNFVDFKGAIRRAWHLPSQLGNAWFHWWFLSHMRGSSSLSVYPGSQLKVTVERILKLLPWRWPFTGIPGSRQESDSRVTPETHRFNFFSTFFQIVNTGEKKETKNQTKYKIRKREERASKRS